MASFPSPQPAKGELARRRIAIRAVANELGLSHHYLGRVINGYLRPSARVVDGLVELLGLPAHELFDPDTLVPAVRFPGNAALAERQK